jgi:hypothetical protein
MVLMDSGDIESKCTRIVIVAGIAVVQLPRSRFASSSSSSSEGEHAAHPSSKTSQLPFTPPRSTRGIEEGGDDVPPVSDTASATDDDEGGVKALVR